MARAADLFPKVLSGPGSLPRAGRRLRGRGPLLAAALALLLVAGPCSALTASTAADVCAAGADPCNVTSAFDVTPGSTLDFGTRSVSVSGAGQFNFGTGSASILCGNFTAATSNPALIARGSLPAGGTGSGTIAIDARRRCSALSSKAPCLADEDCDLGACDTRRCSKKSTRACAGDANCQLGTCGANRRCSGSATIVRCATNADCDLGTCPVQLTCARRGENPVSCSSDGDCFFGSCSVGTGSIAMGGAISGFSDHPALVTLQAADNVSITKAVNVASTSSQSDGGSLSVLASSGSVTISAKINATGGSASQGGSVTLFAGADVAVGEEVNVSGGDFDGGAIEIDAGRDVIVGRSLLASSVAGAGFGGDVVVDAGRDLRITGVSSLNKTTIETNGNASVVSGAGDGGSQDFTAGRDFSAGANTRLLARGSAPDGEGGDVYVDADGAVTLGGDLVVKADGGSGAGGLADVDAGTTLSVAPAAAFDLSGGAGGGGDLSLRSAANADIGGAADVGASNGGAGGSARVSTGGDVRVTGVLGVNGSGAGLLEVQGCRIDLAAGSKLDGKTPGGANVLVARESMKLLAGSTVSTGTGGSNTLIHRTSAKPPLLQGTITPAPKKVVDETLAGCPVCGNAEVDAGETCDDGNTSGGDGCSAGCQNEKCLAQTIAPGWPAVALCEDGDPCTADSCNTSQNGGTCRHPARNCDDGFACTADSCAGGVCLHSPNDGACDDLDPCTDDFCSVQSGCATTANTAPCDDGDSCTEGDQCSAKACQGAFIPGCGFCGDGFVQPPEQCDDGNATFVAGEYCAAGCIRVPCGKPTNSGGTLPKSSDALFTLRAAVGQATCSPRVCDVDKSGKILSSDALRVLRAAVGQAVALSCPAS